MGVADRGAAHTRTIQPDTASNPADQAKSEPCSKREILAGRQEAPAKLRGGEAGRQGGRQRTPGLTTRTRGAFWTSNKTLGFPGFPQ